MSSWLEQLKPASFRGMSFKTDSLKFVVGDDVIVREYPFRDLPTWQSAGGATDEIHMPAYVIGDDYITQRDALAELLRGEGELVHPTRGRIKVAVKGKVSVSENPTREGGMARFDITFIRAEKRRGPSAKTNTKVDLRAKSQAAEAAALADFGNSFTLVNQPGWVQASSKNWLEQSTDFIRAGLGRFDGGVGDVKGTINGLLEQPLSLAESLRDIYNLPADLSDNIDGYYSGLKSLFSPLLNDRYSGFSSEQSSGYSTESRQQARANNMATLQLTESLATIRAAEASSYRQYDNQAQAQQARVEMDTQFRAVLLQGTRSQQSFQALLDLHAATLADIAARSTSSLALTEYTPKGSEPFVLISYKLYGTAKYAFEIAEHNPHILHPMLVPAGKPLVIVARDEVQR